MVEYAAMGYKTKINKLQLKSLSEFPDNPQEVAAEKMALIKKAMREKGWYGELPLIWECPDGNKYIVSGNHRVMCAIDVGIIESDCIIIADENYTWQQAKTDCLMFNNLHGNPDHDKTKDFIENILDEFSLSVEQISDDIGLSTDDILESLEEKKESKIKKETLNPYKKTHILLSFDPGSLIDIQPHIENILKIEGVEIEQSSN